MSCLNMTYLDTKPEILGIPPFFSYIKKKKSMKNLYLLLFILTIPVLTIAQNDCTPFLPMEQGTVWELTNYDKKGKEEGKIVYEMLEKAETSEGLTFKVRSTIYDKKEKELFDSEFEAYCKDGRFEYDMAFKMSPETMQAYQGMDVEVNSSELAIPSFDSKPGTTLPDASLEVTVAGNSPIKIKVTTLITDRTIEAIEEITTPAGTFKCVKLSQTVSVKSIMKRESSMTEWYAEGIGLVKAEYYNKNGKLQSYSELTKLKK